MVQEVKNAQESGNESFGYIITTPDGKQHEYTAGQADSMGLNSRTFKEGVTMYRNDDTEFSTKPTYKASLTYDNGKVTLTATKSLVDRNPSFLDEMRSNKTLQSAIAAYEGGHDVKYTDPDDDSKTYSAEDILKMWQEGLQDYIEDYANLAKNQDLLNELGGGAKFSEDQTIIASSSTSRDKDGNSTSKIIYLPSMYVNAKKYGFDKYASYDAKTGTINAKDFYTWYNLDKQEDGIDKSKEELIQELRQTIEGIAQTPGYFFGEPDENGNRKEVEETKDAFVRALSLYNTLNNDRPGNDNFFTGASFLVRSAATSFAKSAGDWALNIASVIKAAGHEWVPWYNPEDSAVEQAGKNILGSLWLPTALANIVTGIEILGDFSGDAVANGMDHALGSLGQITEDVYTKNRIKEVKEGWDSVTSDQLATWQKLAVQSDMGAVAGSIIFEIVKQLTVTNKIGAAVGDSIKVFLSGASFGQGVSVLLGTANAAQLAQAIGGILKGAGALGFGMNVLAQGVVDAIMNDGATIAHIIREGDDDTVAQLGVLIGRETAFNLMGEVTGLGASKGWEAFVRNTKTGKFINAYALKVTNAIGAKKHTFLAWLSDKIHGTKTKGTAGVAMDAATGEAYVTNFHRVQAEAMTRVAKSKILGTEQGFEAAVKAQDDLVIKRIALENAYRDRQYSYVFELLSLDQAIDPKVIKSWSDSLAAVQKLYGGEGLDVASGRMLPKDAIDYFYAKYMTGYYENKTAALKRLNKTLDANDTKGYNLALEKVKAFESANPEKAIAIQAHLKAVQQYEFELKNLNVKLGIEREEDIARIRGTGYFGEKGDQYVMAIRTQPGQDDIVTAFNKMENSTNFKTKTAIQNYNLKPGTEDLGYLDPNLVLFAMKANSAKVLQSRRWGNALLDSTGIGKVVANDAITSAEARELVHFRAAFEKDLSSTLRSISKDISSDLFFSASESMKVKRAAMKAAQEKTSAAAKKVVDAYGLTPSDIKVFAASMTPDQVNLISTKFSLPDFTKEMSEEEFMEFFLSLPKTSQNLIASYLAGTRIKFTDIAAHPEITYANYKAALENSANLELVLKKSAIANDKKILKSKDYLDMVRQAKEAQMSARELLILNQAKEEYETLYKAQKAFAEKNAVDFNGIAPEDFAKKIVKLTDDLTNTLSSSVKKSAGMKKILQYYTDAGIDEETAMKYILYNALNSKKGKSAIKDMLKNYLGDAKKFKSLSNQGQIDYEKILEKALNSNIESELNIVTRQIIDNGGESLIDMDALFERVTQYARDIGAAYENPNVIRILNEDGSYRLVEVDPLVAGLYNTRPNFSANKSGVLTKTFRQTNRLMRLGTTGWSLSSFSNQWFRDTLNSYVMAGLTRTIGQNVRAVSEVMGADIVSAMKSEMTEAGWAAFEKEATSGLGEGASEAAKKQAIELAATNKEIRQRAITLLARDQTTSMKYFRGLSATGDLAAWEAAQGKARRSLVAWLEDKSLGEFRETMLRKANFAQAYRNSVDAGRTVQQSREWAQYMMDNATTDFSRAFAWGNKVVNSIPYLGAAINGAASFWRIVEVDPMAVAGRFMFGMVVPTMVLLAQSLSDEENLAVYKNIPEYEKADAVAFVVNGRPVTIPIPQELSAFLAPFRQVVEKAYGASDNSWLELISNDILAIPAVDLSEFVDLDYNKLLGDPSLADRFSRLAESAISQLSPVIVKSIYMLMTGRDPYTGNDIDTSYTYLDADGNMQIMDYTESTFARSVASIFGNDLSPSAAYALLKNFFGKGLVSLIDDVIDLTSLDFNSIANRMGENLTSPFTMYIKDAAEKDWKNAVNVLEQKKQELYASGVLQKINSQISQEKDEQRRKVLVGEYNSAVQEYQRAVITMANNLKDKYAAQYDKSKLAAVISLLNFDDSTGYLGNADDRARATEDYYAGREHAISTMAKLGFNGKYDYSLFGYLATDKDGNVEKVMTSPLKILNATNIQYSQNDIHLANLEAMLKNANITRKEMFYGDDGYYTNINKGMSKKQAKAAWNKKVIPVIYDYVNKNGWADTILNSTDIVDMLDNVIFVDNPYKTKEYLKKVLKGDE